MKEWTVAVLSMMEISTSTSRHRAIESSFCSVNRIWSAAATTDKTGNKTGKSMKEWTVAIFAKTKTSSHQGFESSFCSVNCIWAAAATTDKTGNKTGKSMKEWTVAILTKMETSTSTSSHQVSLQRPRLLQCVPHSGGGCNDDSNNSIESRT
jgi:hypothetical protein